MLFDQHKLDRRTDHNRYGFTGHPAALHRTRAAISRCPHQEISTTGVPDEVSRPIAVHIPHTSLNKRTKAPVPEPSQPPRKERMPEPTVDREPASMKMSGVED